MTAPSETTGYEIAQRCAVTVAALVPMLVYSLAFLRHGVYVSSPFFLLGICVLIRLAAAVVFKEKRFPWDFYVAFSVLSWFWVPHVAYPLARFIYALLGEPL